MSRYLARQPIFDADRKVVAYELLFRAGLENYFREIDGDQATGRVIADSFLLFGIDSLIGSGKAFINFTRSILLSEYVYLLPKDIVVVELLENVAPDREVVQACRRLKMEGYSLALDDFVYSPQYHDLIELADIIKVDFLQSDVAERRRLAEEIIPRGVDLLAEKVETQEEFDQALGLGYRYFQGFFFSRPVIVSRKDIPGYKMNLLRILKEANESEINFDRLSEMIQTEVAFSYKLLKLVNSAAFSPRSKITNVKRALGYLGENGVRKWTSLLTLAGVGDDKPKELLVTSLVRAKFFENLAAMMELAGRKADFFLMGLFSLLDAIIGRPLTSILEHIHLDEEIRLSILGQGPYSSLIKMVLFFERGKWQKIDMLASQLDIPDTGVSSAYNDAMLWSQEIIDSFGV